MHSHNAEDYLRRAEWEAWWAQHRGWVELIAPDLFGARAAGRDEPPGGPGLLPLRAAGEAAAAAATGEPDFEGLFALIEAALEPDRPGR